MCLQSLLPPKNSLEIVAFPLINTYTLIGRNPNIMTGILYNEMN